MKDTESNKIGVNTKERPGVRVRARLGEHTKVGEYPLTQECIELFQFTSE